MRALLPVFLLAGCCDLGIAAGEDCDTESTTDPTTDPTTRPTTTGDPATQGTTRPASTLDLSAPSGNDEYDRYTQAIMDLDIATPPSTPFQLHEGMTGLFDPDAGNLGSVFTRSDPDEMWHKVEHWFLATDPLAYDPSLGFNAEYLFFTLWDGAETYLQANQPQWQAQAYLCMDLYYKATIAELPGLGFVGPEVTRWEFDVAQNGGNVASLLREQHDHPSLGVVYVDFWSFQPGFEFVGLGEDALDLIPRLGPAQPPMDWIQNEPPNQLFARTLYRVQTGADFDLATSAKGCPE